MPSVDQALSLSFFTDFVHSVSLSQKKIEPSHFQLLVFSMCSTSAARVGVNIVAASLLVGRLFHRFCSCNCAVPCACCASAAGARLPASTVAAARPRLPLPMPGGPNFTA